MGTSGPTKGSGSNSALVPTWLNEPPAGPLPGNDPATSPSEGPDGGEQAPRGDGGAKNEQIALAPIQAPPEAARFSGARANFTSFARSGGADRPALRRAVRDYVRSGTRGSANAVTRMGPSRDTASRALGVFRGFQRDGVEDTLLRLNLGISSGARRVTFSLVSRTYLRHLQAIPSNEPIFLRRIHRHREALLCASPVPYARNGHWAFAVPDPDRQISNGMSFGTGTLPKFMSGRRSSR
jgi:hypothetical protein